MREETNQIKAYEDYLVLRNFSVCTQKMYLRTIRSFYNCHVHLHCLVTYGGIKNNEWQWPKRKKKIAGYRAIRSRFKQLFIASIEKQLKKTGWKNNGIDLKEQWRSLKKEIVGKEWNVSNSRPTMNSQQVEEYLGRYVNRVAISKSRLTYLSETKEVQIIYNDYRNQKKEEAAPKKIKPMLPLVAIDKMLQHVLEPYFQTNRYYGLHASSTYKKIKDDLPEKLKRVGRTIKTVFEILRALLGSQPMSAKDAEASIMK